MDELPEDLSAWSLEELQQRQAENSAASRELRLKSASLVNSRLAKAISLDDYLAARKLGSEAAAECKKNATALDNEIAFRRAKSALR